MEADELHKLNMNVIAVGVGNGVDQAELATIASDPKNVYTVSDFDALNNIKHELEQVTCNGQQLTTHLIKQEHGCQDCPKLGQIGPNWDKSPPRPQF